MTVRYCRFIFTSFSLSFPLPLSPWHWLQPVEDKVTFSFSIGELDCEVHCILKRREVVACM